MDRDAQLISAAFRDIWKAIEDNSRRMAASHMTGTVAVIDGNRVRLELLPASERTGKPFLSPWVQVQEAAGGTATHTPVAVGDPMRLLSPQGEIGPASLAVRDSHVQGRPNPSDDPDELVIAHAGGEIRMRSGSMLLKLGSTQFELTEKGIRQIGHTVSIDADHLEHNGTNVGATHKHGGVRSGDSVTATPS